MKVIFKEDEEEEEEKRLCIEGIVVLQNCHPDMLLFSSTR